jgi:hypothetical protein
MKMPIFIGDQFIEDTKHKALMNVTRGKVAAYVSNEYDIIQHKEVTRTFLTTLDDLNLRNNTRIAQFKNRLVVDTMIPDMKTEAAKGETFMHGFRLINSYDKTTGIIIQPRMMRLVCSNGMTIESKEYVQSFHYRHNQEMSKNFENYLNIAIKQIIDNNEKFKLYVSKCMEDSIEWNLLKRITTHLIKQDKHREIINNIIESKMQEGKITRWDLYNAITEYATHGFKITYSVEEYLQKQAQTVMFENFDNLLGYQVIA